MAIIDKKIESKSYGHGGLFEVDDRFRAWGSNDLDKMLKQLYKIGHPIDTHFLYLNIAQKAYKQREDPKMRALFKKIAIEHASVFDALKPVLYFKIGSGKDAEAVLPSVPSFQHLAIVYTEDGEYEKAIGICDKAEWSEPLRVDNELSNINSWREVHEKDEAALRPSIQDISSS